MCSSDLGYLTKDATAEEIEHAIRALIAGQTHLDSAIQMRLVTAVLDQPPPWSATGPAPSTRPDLPDELTPREVEVLKLIADGLSNAQIADKLVLTSATVVPIVNNATAPGKSFTESFACSEGVGGSCSSARSLTGANSHEPAWPLPRGSTND